MNLGHFREIHSIELSPEWYEFNVRQFANNSDVEIHHGNSKTVLPQLLMAIDEPVIAYLDAHYSGGSTAYGEEETPLLEELEALRTRRTNDVVVVDDIRLLGVAGEMGTAGDEIYPAANFDWTDVTEQAVRSRIRVGSVVVQNRGQVFSSGPEDQLLIFPGGTGRSIALAIYGWIGLVAVRGVRDGRVLAGRFLRRRKASH